MHGVRPTAAAHLDAAGALRDVLLHQNLPALPDARPKVDAWRRTLPSEVSYVEHIAKWRDRAGVAFAYRIESVPSFVVDGKYLVAIDSWDPAHTDAAIGV